MYSVILCGGSGTRLWPLSRKNYPKQFLRLYSEHSLLQETYLRLRKLMPTERIFCVTNQEGYAHVLEQIQAIDHNFDASQTIIEPKSLNTAPAMAIAVKYLVAVKGIKEDGPIVFVPSDHHIGNVESYLATLKKAFETVDGHIGTIGIRATAPETGYGYIRKGEPKDGAHVVVEFCEKPDRKTAEAYLASGNYAWNSGMYMMTAGTFTREIERHAPDIGTPFKQTWEDFVEAFAALPSISFDYAVSEKSDNVVVYEGDFGWSDIGSFDSLAEISDDMFEGRHIGVDSDRVFVYSATDRLIATIGVEDIAIVEAGDSILVYKRGRAEDVKKIVEKLKESGAKEIEHTHGFKEKLSRGDET